MTVVNYPHAESNPDGGAGNRLNGTRKEKSHLRRVATHVNDSGVNCERCKRAAWRREERHHAKNRPAWGRS